MFLERIYFSFHFSCKIVFVKTKEKISFKIGACKNNVKPESKLFLTAQDF